MYKPLYSKVLPILCVFPAVAAWAAGGASTDDMPGTAEFNLFGKTVEVVLALLIVIGLLVATLWLFRRILRVNRFPGIPQGAVSILEIRHIDPKRAVTLIRVMDRVLIVAWTDNGVALLGELTSEEAARLNGVATPNPIGFSDILSRFTGKRPPQDASRMNGKG